MLTALAFALLAQTSATQIAVMPTHIDDNAKAEIPELFDDHVLTVVQSLPEITAIGQDDINTMLGLEQQKELLGCDDVSCIAEIGGALGVDKLMVMKVARVGAKWAVTAKIMTTDPPSVEKRTSNFVEGGVEELMEAVAWIVPELFGHAVEKPAEANVIATPEPEPEPEPMPETPTPYEVSLKITVFTGGDEDPDDATPPEERPQGGVLIRKGFNAAASFGWRYASLGPSELLLETTAGFGSHRFMETNCDGGNCSGSTGEDAVLWLEVMQLVRLPFSENNERWLLVPSDRIGFELGVGGHAMVLGPASEAGLSARATLFGAWFTAGVQLAVGSTTGVQLGPIFGLRFGF